MTTNPTSTKTIPEVQMTIAQKGEIIRAIISHLKFHAREQKKAFNEGDTFLSLAFKSDAEIRLIAKLTGC